jgi:hypothetical protein
LLKLLKDLTHKALGLLQSLTRVFWLTLAACWAMVVVVMSLMPASALPSLLLNIKDLVLHAVAYGLMSFLMTMGSRSPLGPWRPALVVTILGTGLEFLQPIVTDGRVFSAHDLMANSCGMILGLLMAMQLKTWLSRQKN